MSEERWVLLVIHPRFERWVEAELSRRKIAVVRDKERLRCRVSEKELKWVLYLPGVRSVWLCPDGLDATISEDSEKKSALEDESGVFSKGKDRRDH